MRNKLKYCGWYTIKKLPPDNIIELHDIFIKKVNKTATKSEEVVRDNILKIYKNKF